MLGKVRNFFGEVAVELKKVAWLTRAELIDSTKIVIISAFFLGIFIMAIDIVLVKALSLLIR
jgi:preprotein translocase SecE subunit